MITGSLPDSTTSVTSRALSTVASAVPRCSPARSSTGRAVAAVGFEQAGEQRLGDLGLQAAALAARAAGAVGIDDDVADLAGRVRRAGEQAPVEDEPGADALVDADADQVRRRALAEHQLGERRGVGVVDDLDGQGELGAELGGQRHVRPPEVGGGDDDAGGVDDARAGDADAEQRPVGVGDQLAADPAHQCHGCPSRLALALVGAPDDDLAGEVDDGPDEPRRLGEVEAEDVAAVGVDADEGRRLADPAVVLSPSSSTTPSASRSRTTADTVALVSPVTFARSARDVGPSRCSVPSSRLRFALRASSGVAIYSFV